MSKHNYTVLESNSSQEILLELRDNNLWIGQDDLSLKLNWTLKPEGLCKEEICVPVKQPTLLSSDGQINLTQFAQELNRPLALELNKNVVFLGESANDRSVALYSQQAPEITLPDLDGNLHNLSEHFGKKLCLVVHASW
jgi:hypothetical protein|tara:strand:+ start:557 stop:973 length:417 start_codon:yes stop_codon:yes gene_type:complete